MKYDKLELEMLTLAHITKNAKSMERLMMRKVGAEHFDYISENDKISYTNALFRQAGCPHSAAPRSLHRFHARQGYRIASGGRALSLPNRGRRMARPKPRNRRAPQRHTSSQSKGCVAPTTWQFLSFYSVP